MIIIKQYISGGFNQGVQMDRLSVTQVSEEKQCSRQAVHDAIKSELLDADRYGGMGCLVKKNKSYI